MSLPILETPTFIGKIPSSGKQIEFRPFLVKEQKVLLLALETNDLEQIYISFRDIIKSCVKNLDEDFDKMPSFDIESIFLQISSKSIGETSRILSPCSKCGTQNEVTVNLDKVELKNNGKSAKKEKQDTIMITDKIGVKMKYPSLSDFIKNPTTKTNSSNSSDIIYQVVASSIENVFDEENVYPVEDSTKEELDNFLGSLSIEQMKSLESFFEDVPYLAVDVEFKCTECGTHNNKEIKGMQNFFS